MQFPERNEVIVCKISKIMDYGVIVELLEFEGIQGFVHISQVSSSWIKNIRNFVKEGQMRAAKVINVDASKSQVDLSFVRVTAREQRKRIDDFKAFKRAQKLLELLASQTKTDLDSVWEEAANPLIEEFDSLPKAFLEIKLKKSDALKKIPKKFAVPLLELIDKSIETPKKAVEGKLMLSSDSSSGVEEIKKAVKAGIDAAKGKDVEIIYLGSGSFHVKSTSFDYKDAEKNINLLAEAALKSIKGSKGEGSFELKGK